MVEAQKELNQPKFHGDYCNNNINWKSTSALCQRPLTFWTENWHTSYSCPEERSHHFFAYSTSFSFRAKSLYRTDRWIDRRMCASPVYLLHHNCNKDRSNLVNHEIADRCCHLVNLKSLFSYVGSKCMLCLEVWPHRARVLGPTSALAKWYLHPSNGLSRVHECDRWQTDHATQKCVAIDKIACAARSDSA